MCRLCDEGKPQEHPSLNESRRDFLKISTATAASAVGLNLFSAPARADDDQGEDEPGDTGKPGRRYIIRGGSVMTMDPGMPNKGEFAQADVLVEGKKILAVGPNLKASGADVIDATGRIVMPGFIDTHHHQFRRSCAAGSRTGYLSVTTLARRAGAGPTSKTFCSSSRPPIGRRTSTSTSCSGA